MIGKIGIGPRALGCLGCILNAFAWYCLRSFICRYSPLAIARSRPIHQCRLVLDSINLILSFEPLLFAHFTFTFASWASPKLVLGGIEAKQAHWSVRSDLCQQARRNSHVNLPALSSHSAIYLTSRYIAEQVSAPNQELCPSLHNDIIVSFSSLPSYQTC